MARPSRNEIADLLNKSKGLVPNIGGQTRLRRSLPQIELASEQFFDQLHRSSGAAQRKGLTLLAQNRVDTEAHQKSRELLDFQHNTVSTEGYVADTDIETHLKLNQDTLIVHALEESMQDTIYLHERKVNQRLTDDWNQAREELLSAVGQSRGGAAIHGNFGTRPVESPLPLPMLGVQRALSKFSGKERAYMEVVEEMNTARQASQPSQKLNLPVINKFLSSERSTSGQVCSTLEDQRQTAWELLGALVDERSKPPESSYSGWKRDDQLLLTLLRRNIKFLEKVWRESYLGDGSDGHVEEEKFAQKFPQNNGQRRDPWGVVYCYLRCGKYDAAIKVMQNIKTESNCEGYDTRHCHSDEMHSVFLGLCLWKDRMEGRKPRDDDVKTVLELESNIKQAQQHPQKKAVLTLLCQINGGERLTNTLGQFELKPISIEIESASEDFLWRNLCVIRALYNEDANFGLSNLSSVINILYGPDNFDDYFTVLLHCFEFEEAISYLCRIGRHFDAVHFAIALNHYGLLKRGYDHGTRYALNQQRLGVYMTGENKFRQKEFRLGQLFYDYFEQYNDDDIGVRYLALLYKVGGEPGVTEDSTRERNRFLAKLLNLVQLDVLTKIIGHEDEGVEHSHLCKYIKDDVQVTRIIKLAAHEADEKHATERAIRLHVKARQFNRAYDLVNCELGQFGKGKGMEELLKEAKRFQNTIKEHKVEPKHINERKQRTLGLLIDMWSFFKYEREADYRSALNISSVVELMESEPLKKRQKLNDYDEPVTRNVDGLCLAYMRCLVSKFQAEPSERDECKIKAGALFSFAQDPKRQLRYDTRDQLQRLYSQIY